jgi:DNA polymerase III subunit delta'
LSLTLSISKKCNSVTSFALAGRQALKQRLEQALSGSLGHAYLFVGPQGVGRKTAARAFAKALLCHHPVHGLACGSCPACRYFSSFSHPDYRELAVQKNERVIPVESVRRQISADLFMKPQVGSRKVYLVAGDDLNEQGQNALLKSLEEPPPYAVFLMTAVGPDHLLSTLVSRMSLMIVSRCTEEEIQVILDQHGYKNHPDRDFLARFSRGIPGAALHLAESDWFSDLRRETIAFFLHIPGATRTDLLTTGYQFLNDNRMHVQDIIDILDSLVRDLLVLNQGGHGGQLMNTDQYDQLTRFLVLYDSIEALKNHLINAHAAIHSARRGLVLNASFEGLACHLLLVLRKELIYG